MATIVVARTNYKYCKHRLSDCRECTWCVSPRLIVGGEYAKVTATDKVLIV